MNIFEPIETLVESCIPTTLPGFIATVVMLGLILLALHLK